ncbi:MAG: RHS repeat-associated core domain-containing protein [Fibrobacter sp.]|mgnify:CR=1 FL=1|nr:RHS repeat-associated core domain-containing protein [Fibrobacter sp.]
MTLTNTAIVNPVCDIPVGFAGEYGILREPNGLYYMNARYYDPTNGRFLSEDPIGLSGGDLTLYSYAGNNPVVFVDPSGLCSQSGALRTGLSIAGDVSDMASVVGFGLMLIPTPPTLAAGATVLAVSDIAGIAIDAVEYGLGYESGMHVGVNAALTVGTFGAGKAVAGVYDAAKYSQKAMKYYAKGHRGALKTASVRSYQQGAAAIGGVGTIGTNIFQANE